MGLSIHNFHSFIPHSLTIVLKSNIKHPDLNRINHRPQILHNSTLYKVNTKSSCYILDRLCTWFFQITGFWIVKCSYVISGYLGTLSEPNSTICLQACRPLHVWTAFVVLDPNLFLGSWCSLLKKLVYIFLGGDLWYFFFFSEFFLFNYFLFIIIMNCVLPFY